MEAHLPAISSALPDGMPANVSRRAILGMSLGALVLGVALPDRSVRAQGTHNTPGRRVAAFLEIRRDGSVLLRSPFIEGGQGIDTALAQIVGEELDVEPARFTVICAPPGADYALVNGLRYTADSRSVRSSYPVMRELGAKARQMLIQAAAARLRVPARALTTQPGLVLHTASGRRIDYGALAAAAATLPVPETVSLRANRDFRWIGKPVPRLDARDKSTGKAVYAIDVSVPDMLQAAVVHAPRLGMEPAEITNEADVRAMPGVDSIHRLPGAVAVLSNRWWQARRAAEALQVTWSEPVGGTTNALPADFSSEGMRAALAAAPGPGMAAETHGDIAAAMQSAARVVDAVYDAPYLAHGQLEPPSAVARWNADGTLDLWVPNQAPEFFQNSAAQVADIPAERVRIHSPPLGGFFGRQWVYAAGCPYPQAILLARRLGRPVKVIWSREEEFLRDALRPMGLARMRAGIAADGTPVAMEIEVVGEGPAGRWFGLPTDAPDHTAVQGVAGKPYAFPNRRVAQVRLAHPAMIGFWRAVGHSMNDFFYESFLDEVAEAGRQDPFVLRQRLLEHQPRQRAVLEAVAALSGAWRRGPYDAADGTRRARGVAMASCFGSEVATIAEVSLHDRAIRVHELWVSIDPGSIVNPAIIEAQVNSAAALATSATLLEQVVYVDGAPQARNFDAYPVLRLEQMPRVHLRILQSGAPMGGIGEAGLPAVPPAIVNAVAALTGRRVRSLPLSKVEFGA